MWPQRTALEAGMHHMGLGLLSYLCSLSCSNLDFGAAALGCLPQPSPPAQPSYPTEAQPHPGPTVLPPPEEGRSPDRVS